MPTISDIRKAREFSKEQGWEDCPSDIAIDVLLSWIGRTEKTLHLLIDSCSFDDPVDIENLEELLDELCHTTTNPVKLPGPTDAIAYNDGLA